MYILLFSCKQTTGIGKNPIIQEDTIMINNDSINIEHYDFKVTKNGTENIFQEKEGGRLIEIWAVSRLDFGLSKEYASAEDFYMIYKQYHLNGMIKERVKFTCDLAFGKREFFDEQGNCIKIVDEDITKILEEIKDGGKNI